MSCCTIEVRRVDNAGRGQQEQNGGNFVVEITAAANLRASVTFNYFEAYMILMMIYWVIILVLERIEAMIEQKFDVIYKK